MTETANYHLKKPDATDRVKISDINENMDKLDTELNGHKTSIDTINQTLTSLQKEVGEKTNERDFVSLKNTVSTMQVQIATLWHEVFGEEIGGI